MDQAVESLRQPLEHEQQEQSDNQREESDSFNQREIEQTCAFHNFRYGRVAALIVGGFLGYWIDRWLGSKPWGMVIFFFLGFAAGFLNIYRSQTGQDYKIGFKETTKDKE